MFCKSGKKRKCIENKKSKLNLIKNTSKIIAKLNLYLKVNLQATLILSALKREWKCMVLQEFLLPIIDFF